jgi:hypothetical protein
MAETSLVNTAASVRELAKRESIAQRSRRSRRGIRVDGRNLVGEHGGFCARTTRRGKASHRGHGGHGGGIGVDVETALVNMAAASVFPIFCNS